MRLQRTLTGEPFTFLARGALCVIEAYGTDLTRPRRHAKFVGTDDVCVDSSADDMLEIRLALRHRGDFIPADLIVHVDEEWRTIANQGTCNTTLSKNRNGTIHTQQGERPVDHRVQEKKGSHHAFVVSSTNLGRFLQKLVHSVPNKFATKHCKRSPLHLNSVYTRHTLWNSKSFWAGKQQPCPNKNSLLLFSTLLSSYIC